MAVDISKLPAVLPPQVSRVTADGRPTKWLIDWEGFQRNFFVTTVVDLDTRITEVRSDTDDNSAAITEEVTARTDADGALALRIDTVEATAGDATANGQIYFAAKAVPGGATAAYGLYLTAGSTFTGMELLADSGGGASIAFAATDFKLVDSGTATNVFSWSSLNGYFQFNVPVRLRNGDILDSAVTKAWTDTGTTSAEVTVDYRGSGFLEVYAQFDGDAGAYVAIDQFVLRVRQDGSSIGDTPITQSQNGTGSSAVSRYGATSVIHIRTPSIGSHTYKVEIIKTVSATATAITGVTLIVKEYSK
jgi:hypothetical protein